MPTLTRSAAPDSYFALVREFPLRSIRSEAELDAAELILHRLLARRLDRGETLYRDALTDLIEVYEEKSQPIPDAPEAEVLALLMESNALSQSALAREVGISQSTLSAVLSGTRSLTREQVVNMARRFNVSPSAFLPV